MQSKVIEIAGAGPAGLAAAIALARRGFAVRVFERRLVAGSRFNDDFQGLENWSSATGCIDELQALGVEPNWWSRPFSSADFFGPGLRHAKVRALQPLFHCIRRGPLHPDSLDNALRRQAHELGVEIRWGCRMEPADVQIFAGGPGGRPMGIARGLTFALEHPELSCTIVSDALAGNGYVYFIVADGQATLATVLVGRFAGAAARLRLAVQTVERLYGIRVPSTARQWTGSGRFFVPDNCRRGQTLLIGEAAGIQDAFLGFGLRAAMLSGALAARAIAEGLDYDSLWRQRLLPFMEASRVNRAVFDRVGAAKSLIWVAARLMPDGDRLLRSGYALSHVHRLALAWARRHFQRAGYG
jgi:2-polyprenyl-6-methoxyphenol hydroxylase-like FAD-dependent oxidoreductase